MIDRIAYAFWMIAPFTLRDTRLGRWLLPFAGRHAYSAAMQKEGGK